MSKHRSSTSSERLQKVLRLLEAARGWLSTWEIQEAAHITDVKDALYELRSNGEEITSEWVEETRGEGKRPRRYKRHILTRFLQAQRTLPLDLDNALEATP